MTVIVNTVLHWDNFERWIALTRTRIHLNFHFLLQIKALTHSSLGRHDGDVIKDYQRSKSLDALRKRKRSRVAAIRQSAVSVANHVFGVFKRVKATEKGNRSSGKVRSPKKLREQKTETLSPREQLFIVQNSSIISTTSSSEYEIN